MQWSRFISCNYGGGSKCTGPSGKRRPENITAESQTGPTSSAVASTGREWGERPSLFDGGGSLGQSQSCRIPASTVRGTVTKTQSTHTGQMIGTAVYILWDRSFLSVTFMTCANYLFGVFSAHPHAGHCVEGGTLSCLSLTPPSLTVKGSGAGRDW